MRNEAAAKLPEIIAMEEFFADRASAAAKVRNLALEAHDFAAAAAWEELYRAARTNQANYAGARAVAERIAAGAFTGTPTPGCDCTNCQTQRAMSRGGGDA